LFEVVADDLVELALTTSSGRLEPRGVADVKVGARVLRDPRVGCIADQQVSEREPVLTREQRLAGTDQVASHECLQPLRDVRAIALRGEREDRTTVEPLA